MLLQFATMDDQLWLADVQTLQWAQVSAPGADAASVVQAHGKLIPQGFGIYAFEGRTPKTEGPGPGLCSIGTFVVGIGTAVKIYIRTNVPVKDFTMPVPIKQVLYEILPSDPKQVQESLEAIVNSSQSEQEPNNAGGDSNPSGDSSGNLALDSGSENTARTGPENSPATGSDPELV